jgi:sorting nexin-41/42
MWDDEDNNPYGSFTRRDSEGSEAQRNTPCQYSTEVLTDIDEADYAQGQRTPPSDGEYGPSPTLSAEPAQHETDDDHEPAARVEPKKGGYDSRIEQLLYENQSLEIQIVSAGKNAEGGGYIVYTIRTGVGHPIAGLGRSADPV